MKFILAVIALVLIAASLIADHLWRKWIAARRRERELDPDHNR